LLGLFEEFNEVGGSEPNWEHIFEFQSTTSVSSFEIITAEQIFEQMTDAEERSELIEKLRNIDEHMKQQEKK